jgi:cytochrome c oxidase assembly factor CtaG
VAAAGGAASAESWLQAVVGAGAFPTFLLVRHTKHPPDTQTLTWWKEAGRAQVLFAASLVIMHATLMYITSEAFVCLHALFSLPLLFTVAVTYNKYEAPRPRRPHTHHA